MNLSFTTLGCAEKNLADVVALAKEYGIHTLEIRGLGDQFDNRWVKEFRPEEIDNTIAYLKENDISIVALDTSCNMHVVPNDKTIAEAKAAIDIAEKLGAKYIRVFGNEIKGDRDECIAHVIAGLRELCEHAENTSVQVLLEVHGEFNCIEVFEPIVKELGSYKSFGILWDIMHTNRTYGENWAKFYEAFKSYIRHIHVKDASSQGLVLPGEGDLPIIPITRYLLADGFEGCFSLEWEKKWHPELGDLEEALTAFNKVMAQV